MGKAHGAAKPLSNQILSQFPNLLFFVLLKRILTCFPPPDWADPLFSSGLPFRAEIPIRRKAMPVVAIATTFVSRLKFSSFDIESDSSINTGDPVPDFAFWATLPTYLIGQ